MGSAPTVTVNRKPAGAGLTRWACTEAMVPPGLDWLVPTERSRAERARFTKRRNEYLLRRYAGKQAAAAYLGLDGGTQTLGTIGVLNRPGGAPYVEVDGKPVGVDISLTDRAGAAVALVGPMGSMSGGTLGVDLEIVETRSEAFVADFLTEPEQAWVRAQRDSGGQDGWDAAANLIWSAKEAALKVLRVGLRADTRSVTVTVDPAIRQDGWAPLRVTHESAPPMPGWWRRDGAFVLTVAAAAPLDPPAELPGGADLAAARPVHSWLADPLVRKPGLVTNPDPTSAG